MSVESPVQKLSPDNQREDLAFVTCGDFSGTLTVCFSLFTAIAITKRDHQMGLNAFSVFHCPSGQKTQHGFLVSSFVWLHLLKTKTVLNEEMLRGNWQLTADLQLLQG